MWGLDGKIDQYWKLLDETAALLSRTSVKSRFERQLAAIALRFQSAPANLASLEELHGVLTELRRELRLLGYDLSMGKYTLILDGLRNDEAFGSLTRMVLAIDQNGAFYWKTGDANHLALFQSLENSIMKIKSTKKVDLKIRDLHYLWFKKTKSTVTLSGSATETGEAYERLKKYAEADGLLFLSRLKGLL
jgi:hypothetical protein